MVGAETGADMRDLSALRVVHREMAAGALNGKELRRRMIRSLFAVIRVIWGAYRGREPDARLFVEHRVVDVVLARPDRLTAPIGRWLNHQRRGWRRVRIPHGELHL